MQYVNRKKRLNFERRGCYFKHKGREIFLPKNMMEKKVLLKKLIDTYDKIPDFRKNLGKQQLRTNNADTGPYDGGRGDISMVKFKQHEKQFL